MYAHANFVHEVTSMVHVYLDQYCYTLNTPGHAMQPSNGRLCAFWLAALISALRHADSAAAAAVPLMHLSSYLCVPEQLNLLLLACAIMPQSPASQALAWGLQASTWLAIGQHTAAISCSPIHKSESQQPRQDA
jgi:hypothetical protein